MSNELIRLYNEKLREEYYHCKHKSGLSIYVFPKDMTSSYALFGTRYGSFYNGLGFENGKKLEFPSGMAHFLEHKLFSNENGEDAFEVFASLGADANAYTSFNKTVYLFSAAENFVESLEQLLDFVSHPYFTKENVKKEKAIIAQEIKMCDDNPYDVLFTNMLKGLYGEGIISENICGTEKSIKKITPELLYECYRLFYRYSNMALVVCGNVTVESVLEAADRMLPEREEPESFVCEEIRTSKNSERDYIESVMPVGKTVFQIGIKDDGKKDIKEMQKRDIGMTVLDQMIFSKSADLYNEMFDLGLVGESWSFGYSITRDIAFHSICGESDDPRAALSYIRKYLDVLREKGLDEEDFKRCKRIFEADFVRDFDSVEDIANNLIDTLFDGGEIFEYGKAIEDITFSDVCGFFEDAFFDEGRYTLSVIKQK